MKLKELSNVLWSDRCHFQNTVVYDYDRNIDVENGCSVEYAIEHYGEKEVRRIHAYEHQLVITI